MNELIKELEEATEGNRELDIDVALTIKPDHRVHSRHPNVTLVPKKLVDRARRGYYWSVPHYTTSLDAALILVPEDWGLDLTLLITARKKEPSIHMFKYGAGLDDEKNIFVEASTPALALCIAALKARETQK